MFVGHPGYVEGIMPHSYHPWNTDIQDYMYQHPFDMNYQEDTKPLLTNLDEPPKYIPPQPPHPPPHANMVPDHTALSTVGKSSFMDTYIDCSKWKQKPIREWTPTDVVQWICEEAQINNYEIEAVKTDEFRVDGPTLLRMSEQEFVTKDRYYGYPLYQTLQKLKTAEDQRNRMNAENLSLSVPPFGIIRPVIEEPVYTELDPPYHHNMSSDLDSDHSEYSNPEIKDVVKIKKPVGRPRKIPGRAKRGNKEKKTGRLWEFIRDLLLNPQYCPSLICWEKHDEGIFRFVRSDKVAELWGTIKENPKMTYEKLSRAMRYYYKSKVLQPVLGRRLVYKFGPTAKGWRTSNPNFRDNPK